MFSMFLYLTLYIQDVLGYDPLQAGLRFLPITLMTFVVAPFSGKLSVRVPVRLLLGVGMLCVSGGLLAMTAVDPSSGWTTLIPGFLLAGFGVGTINPPLASTAIGVVHYSRSGMASGINNTFRQVGIATGIAGLGAVFQHQVTSKTTGALVTTAPGREVVAAAHDRLGGALVSGEVSQLARHLPPAARDALGHAYRVGFTDAFTTILIIAASIALVGRHLCVRAGARPRLRHLGRGRRRSARGACRGRRGLSSAQALTLTSGARSRRTRAPAAVDSGDTRGRCARADTARTPSHACWVPAADARMSRTTLPAVQRVTPDSRIGSAAAGPSAQLRTALPAGRTRTSRARLR